MCVVRAVGWLSGGIGGQNWAFSPGGGGGCALGPPKNKPKTAMSFFHPALSTTIPRPFFGQELFYTSANQVLRKVLANPSSMNTVGRMGAKPGGPAMRPDVAAECAGRGTDFWPTGGPNALVYAA